MLELSFYVLELPDYAYTIPNQNLITCSNSVNSTATRLVDIGKY